LAKVPYHKKSKEKMHLMTLANNLLWRLCRQPLWDGRNCYRIRTRDDPSVVGIQELFLSSN